MAQDSKIKPSLFRILILVSFSVVIIACSQKSAQIEVIPALKNDQLDELGERITDDESAVIEEKQKAILDPEQYQLAIDAMAVRDYVIAKQLFESFKNKNPELSGAYLNLALIAIKLNQLSIAESYISQAISINPDQPQAYHLRAQIRLKVGQIKAARNDYDKALALNPEYSIAHYNIALLYDIYLQDIELAIEHYTKYLSLISHEDEETQNWIKHLRNSINNG